MFYNYKICNEFVKTDNGGIKMQKIMDVLFHKILISLKKNNLILKRSKNNQNKDIPKKIIFEVFF